MKKDSIFKQFLVIGSGAIINMIIGLFTTPIITRLVAPEEYGMMSMFTTYSNIVMMIVGLGMDQALVRFFYKNDDMEYKKNLLFRCWSYPVLIIVLGTVVMLILYYMCNIFNSLNIATIILFILNVLFMLFNRLSTLILRLYQMSKMYSLTSIIHKILYVATIIIFVRVIDSNYFVIMAFASVISYFITDVFAIVCKRSVWHPSIKKRNAKNEYLEMIKYGFPLMVASGVYLLFQAIDKISLNFFCTYHEVGIYSSAMSLMSLMSIITSTFNTIWAPASMKQYEKEKNNKDLYIKGNAYITVIMFAVGISLIFGKDIIILFLGEEYRDASMILPFLLFQPIMYTISETTVVGIYFKQKSHAQLIVCIVACICNIIGNVIMIPIIGSKGAAVSTGISYIVFFGLRTWFSNRYYYIDFKLKKFYATTMVTVLYALYNTFIPFNIVNIIFYVAVMAILFIMYRITIKEMINFILIKTTLKERK